MNPTFRMPRLSRCRTAEGGAIMLCCITKTPNTKDLLLGSIRNEKRGRHPNECEATYKKSFFDGIRSTNNELL